MSYKKYADDFRLEVQQRPGRRPKTVAVYHGPRYALTCPPDAYRALRRRLPALSFGAAALFLASLALNGIIVRQLYVMLPYFCAVLPYCFLCASAAGFLSRTSPYTREQNDKIPRRIVRCIPALCGLTGYSLAASAIAAVLRRAELRPAPDFAFIALAAAQFFCSLALLRLRPLLATQESSPQ